MARTDNRKRGAAPRGNSSGGGSRRWPLFAGGLAVGLVLAGGIYLAGILPTAMELREKAAAHAADCADGEAAAKAPATPAGKPADGRKPVTFEFYSILPQQEVVAPVSGSKTTVATAPVVAIPPAANGSGTTPATTTQAEPVATGERYLLQAGSFRTRPEADRRRAELVLSGHSVNVQDVTTSAGEQWFRVMVGPFAGEAAMQQARQQLSAAKIDTLPIRLK